MCEGELVEELAEVMTYCCAERKNKEASGAGNMVTVNVYHERWVEMPLPLQHFRIKVVRKGIKRAHADAGNQARVRRPLSGR